MNAFINKLNKANTKLKEIEVLEAIETKVTQLEAVSAIVNNTTALTVIPVESGLVDCTNQKQITKDEYNNLQQAFDYYNQQLFSNKLNPCIITLQHNKKYYGYCWAEKFEHRTTETKIDEIALNPDLMRGRSDIEILSTLVHEMVHLWQNQYGDAGRRGYHNKEWGNKMKDIGLYPSSTGQIGGKETGEKVSHYILKNEPFIKVTEKFIESGYKLNWQSHLEASKTAKKATRAKFVCPQCDQQAMAKPTAKLACGDCSSEEDNVIVNMIAQIEEATNE